MQWNPLGKWPWGEQSGATRGVSLHVNTVRPGKPPLRPDPPVPMIRRNTTAFRTLAVQQSDASASRQPRGLCALPGPCSARAWALCWWSPASARESLPKYMPQALNSFGPHDSLTGKRGAERTGDPQRTLGSLARDLAAGHTLC